jgi:hypothetical protein
MDRMDGWMGLMRLIDACTQNNDSTPLFENVLKNEVLSVDTLTLREFFRPVFYTLWLKSVFTKV